MNVVLIPARRKKMSLIVNGVSTYACLKENVLLVVVVVVLNVPLIV